MIRPIEGGVGREKTVKHSTQNAPSSRHTNARLLPKKILKGPSELDAENLGAQHMK